jgi:DNA-binding PadR family transcriptional regulator
MKGHNVTAFTIEDARYCEPHVKIRFMGSGRRGHRRGMRRGFGPSGFGPGPFGGRHKAGRGDIRAAILALLAEEPMHGYQIIREIGDRSEGAWMPSPGSVYPTLQQLTDEELVRSSETEGKRVYELTDEGRTQAESREGALPWEEAAEGADDELVALRELVFQVMSATRQVAHAGTTAQLASAQEILRTARKSLYQLLADDAGADT